MTSLKSPARALICTLPFITLALITGCSGRTSVIPNSDKSLRKPSSAFAADAKERHPYKADAPKAGDAVARAQVGYSFNQLEVVNLSDETWTDAEIWVNGTHVVFVPTMKPKDLKVLQFQMICDAKGRSFPISNKTVRINAVEVYRDGQFSNIPLQLAD
ncbi:MAG: hypothetical protein WBD40_24540 [Tepidisphaeraceae bacterium]